jgi:hypothetical protein
MLVLGIAVLAALLIPLVTLGSYKRLFAPRSTGVAARARARDPDRPRVRTIPRRYWHSVGFGLLVASYVLILAFAPATSCCAACRSCSSGSRATRS